MLRLQVINELKFKMTKMPKIKVFYRFNTGNAGGFLALDYVRIPSVKDRVS